MHKSVAHICTTNSDLEYTPLYGGENPDGRKQDFEVLASDPKTPVTGIKVYKGKITNAVVVTGVHIFWADGTHKIVGWSKGSDDEEKEIEFLDGDTVTELTINSSWYVDHIYLRSSSGNTLSAGGGLSARHDVKRLGNGILVGLYGTVENPEADDHIASLGFIFQK